MRDRFDIAAFDPHPAFRLRRGSRSRPFAARHREPNVWPLPSLDGCTPSIVATRIDSIALAYPSTLAHVPKLVPAFAVSDALVKHAGKSYGGHSLVLHHDDGYRSFYDGIEHLFVLYTSVHPRAQRVKAGDIVGYFTTPAARGEGLSLSLSKRNENGGCEHVDVAEAIRTWRVLPWSDERVTPPAAAQPIAA